MGLNFYDYHDFQENQGGYRIVKTTVCIQKSDNACEISIQQILNFVDKGKAKLYQKSVFENELCAKSAFPAFQWTCFTVAEY